MIKRKRAQALAEYAVLIGLVVSAVVAMRVYMVRALQAKMKQAADNFTDAGNANFSNTSDEDNYKQYEPYYLESNYTVESNQSMNEKFEKGGGINRTGINETVKRETGGYQKFKKYNATQ